MGIISWLVLGGISGWIASIIMKKNASMGITLNIVVGIVGALIGGFVLTLLGVGSVTGLNLASILVSIAGACLFLFLLRLISAKTSLRFHAMTCGAGARAA